MTEKRFEINNLVKKGNMSFWDNENKSILNASHTLNLLNNLSEENEQLRKENKELQGKASSWKITASEQIMEQCELIKENEQLKQKLKEHETTLKEQSNSIYQLKKENELKEAIDRIDSLIHTQEDYLAWSIIYETLTDGKPLSYRLKM